jgi:hypothetical protein
MREWIRFKGQMVAGQKRPRRGVHFRYLSRVEDDSLLVFHLLSKFRGDW